MFKVYDTPKADIMLRGEKIMALTDDEQKLFESLMGNFNENPVKKIEANKHRKVIMHALILLTSFALLVYSVYIKQPVLGVASFALMVYAGNGLFSLSRFSRDD